MEKIKVAILLGGESSEREVSLESGKKVAEHLSTDKYEVIKYDPKVELQKLIDDVRAKKIDVVFPVLHGKFGEDGTIQGLLELLHVPYVGCNVLTSALCMDKIKTKQVVSSYGVATPKFQTFDAHEDVDFNNIKLPAVVKPSDAGSSVGVTIPENKEELKKSVKQAFQESRKILIEEFIDGNEFTVGVIGPNNKPDVLPVTQIEANKGKFYNYKSKYEKGGSTHTCPAKINKELTETMQGVAKLVYEIMGCEGMSRVDFMVDSAGKHYFIEVNTIPGMTDTSLLPEAAKAAGISFPKLLDNLIQWALRGLK
ncbi:D-alanine--D-alanine ligase [Patescibacteria group bacterium]|nr:D-alanine--D-alanine ligase [Patescibacteria group bacterium]MBU1673595.1 D-alanine--D-alanine ligase [Patescibacteria group bacterium]MBU1964043.1 D-alanine--D-alanine ligase [Patescibacteria group bacterium]